MPEPVEAPGSAAGCGEIEEHEAIEDGDFAVIIHWVEAHFGMNHEVGDRHFSREDEGREAREEADHQEDASDKLKNSGPARQRGDLKAPMHGRRGHAEQLRGAMLQK